jgi:mRNA interferase HigB
LPATAMPDLPECAARWAAEQTAVTRAKAVAPARTAPMTANARRQPSQYALISATPNEARQLCLPKTPNCHESLEILAPCAFLTLRDAGAVSVPFPRSQSSPVQIAPVPVLGTRYVDICGASLETCLSTSGAGTRQAKVPLERSHKLVNAAQWASTDEVQKTAPKAKLLNRERMRFEVAGGNYRLVAAFDFRRQIAFVKFIGTHAEYDRIDALTVSQF